MPDERPGHYRHACRYVYDAHEMWCMAQCLAYVGLWTPINQDKWPAQRLQLAQVARQLPYMYVHSQHAGLVAVGTCHSLLHLTASGSLQPQQSGVTIQTSLHPHPQHSPSSLLIATSKVAQGYHSCYLSVVSQ